MANGTGNTQGRALHQYGGGPTLQKILLLKLGDIDKGSTKKILVHEKNIIIQLIKTVIFNRDTVGVLSFLMVPTPRDRGCPVSLWGEPFREWGDNDWKEKMSRKSCCPQHGTVKEYRAGGCACRSLRRWWGSRGFVSSAALQPMLNRIPSLCPGLPPCYAETVSLGYANLGVIQPGRI